jgi:hypothetical protein
LAGNLEKPLVSLYETEWREELGYGLCFHASPYFQERQRTKEYGLYAILLNSMWIGLRLAHVQTVIQTSRRLDSFLYEAAQNFEVFSNIQI